MCNVTQSVRVRLKYGSDALAEMPPPWQSKVVIMKLYDNNILTALADATNDLSMPCHEQRSGAATE